MTGLWNGQSEADQKEKELTMVSRCLRGSSLLGACLEKTQRRRRSQPVDVPPHHVMSHCVTSLPPPHSKSHSLSFFALMWPEVEQRGTICNPSVQIFTQRDESTWRWPKKESPVPGSPSLAEPYTAMSAVRRRSGGKDEREENEKVRAERWKPEERGQTDRQAGLRATSEQSLPLARSLAASTADVRHHGGASNTQ